MITASDKRLYSGFKVEQKASANGRYVKFCLGDSKKNQQTGQWENNGYYNCTAFQDLPTFADGVKYKIKKINGVERFHATSGKDYYNLVLEIELVDNDNVQATNSTNTNINVNKNLENPMPDRSVIDSFDKTATFNIMEEDIQF